MVELFVLILQSLPSSSETQQNLPQTRYEFFNPGSVEQQIIGWEDMDWADLAQDRQVAGSSEKGNDLPVLRNSEIS